MIKDARDSARRALLCAEEQWAASIREAAGAILPNDRRSGGIRDSVPLDQCVAFSAPSLGRCATVTTMGVLGTAWCLFHFWGHHSRHRRRSDKRELWKIAIRKNKCLPIHMAAASLCSEAPSAAPKCFSDLALPEVLCLASTFRWGKQNKASAFGIALGEPTSNDPLAVAELRPKVHDVVSVNRDTGHRDLLFSPSSIAQRANLRIARVSQPCRFAAHLINSASDSPGGFI